MTKIDTSTSAVERQARVQDRYEAGDLAALLRALAAERDRLAEERRTLIAALKDGGDIQRKVLERAEKAEAALATARAETGALIEKAAQTAYDTDAKRFREKYKAEYKRKMYQPFRVEMAVNNALDIQSEDAAAAIRALSPDATAALAEHDRVVAAEAVRKALTELAKWIQDGREVRHPEIPDSTEVVDWTAADIEAEIYRRSAPK